MKSSLSNKEVSFKTSQKILTNCSKSTYSPGIISKCSETYNSLIQFKLLIKSILSDKKKIYKIMRTYLDLHCINSGHQYCPCGYHPEYIQNTYPLFFSFSLSALIFQGLGLHFNRAQLHFIILHLHFLKDRDLILFQGRLHMLFTQILPPSFSSLAFLVCLVSSLFLISSINTYIFQNNVTYILIL